MNCYLLQGGYAVYQKWIDLIHNSSLFAGIEKTQLSLMLQCLKPNVQHYQKGHIASLTKDGFLGVGIVLSGELLVFKENSAGTRILINITQQGDIFGEMMAFSENNVNPLAIQAQGPCIVMFLQTNKIISRCEQICSHHQKMLVNLLCIMSDKTLVLNRKLDYLMMKSIRGKISCFLLETSQTTRNRSFMLPMKRNELADFLNISRPSLSREMGRMRDEGIIHFHRSSIHIIDMEALLKIASEN